MTLQDLAIKYASDKWYFHSYIPFYESLFQGRTVRRLLEIGIGYRDLMQPLLPDGVEYVHGSSLFMWRDYFPEAQIFACDIREETLINEGRIRSMVADQSSGVSMANMVFEFCAVDERGMMHDRPFYGFDVIIDDGSHQTPHQLLTFDCLRPRLSEGGVYVIEDCQEPERLAAHTGGTIHKFDKRPDDVLVVIKNDRTEF